MTIQHKKGLFFNGTKLNHFLHKCIKTITRNILPLRKIDKHDTILLFGSPHEKCTRKQYNSILMQCYRFGH